MKTNAMLGFALLLFITGCTSVTTSSLHCSPLTHKEQGYIYVDLNHLLVSNGFTAASASEVPWGMAWSNDSFSPLWKGYASFQVREDTSSNVMDIDVFYYKGEVSANNALIHAIATCMQRDAPSAAVKIKTKKEVGSVFFEE